MRSTESIYLSVIIPCYNSTAILKANLPILLQYLREQSFTWEVIVVDDGGDESPLEEFATATGLRYLRMEYNQGKGAAVKLGMLEAKGDFRIFTDADIPYDVKVIEKMLLYLDQKEMHMVAGDRTLDGSAYYGQISQRRELGSKFFRFIVGRFVTGGIHDTQCGIKGFTAKWAKELFSRSRIKGFAFDAEIYYIALKLNADIKKIPVVLRSNEGKSVRLIKHGFTMTLDLFRIVLNYYRGKYQ